ncbi:MAG: leucine-rich repeat domain-containing protein [Candidatus Thorarchaeota archaeon]
MGAQTPDDKERKSIDLVLNSEKEVESLLQYPNLEELHLRTPIRDIEYSALKELPHLKTLKVYSFSYGKNLSPKNFEYLVSNIPNLESLILGANPATNEIIRIISALSGLKYLRFGFSKSPDIDLSPLSNCVNLIDLGLGSSGQRQGPPDLSFLRSLTELKRLGFGYTRPLDLHPLSSCHKLVELNLSNNILENISLDSLSSCTLLEQLDLSNNHFRNIDLSPLASCTELKQISFRYNRLKEIDLTPLSSCHNLRDLDLGRNLLKEVDLSPLRNADLEILDIHENKLEVIDLSALSGHYNLNSLALDENKLKRIDLSPLRSCKVLRVLRLQRNKLKEIDLSPLADCLFERLDLTNNPLAEIDLTLLSSTVLVDVPLKGSSGVDRGEKVRGGSLWRTRVDPRSVDRIRWPRACIGCGKKEGPFENSRFSWKVVERSEESIGDFQRILYVGVDNNVTGKMYLSPKFLGINEFMSSQGSGIVTNFIMSNTFDVCPNCKKRNSEATDFMDISVHFDFKNKQILFTVDFSSEKYAKLFKRKNRCLKPNS